MPLEPQDPFVKEQCDKNMKVIISNCKGDLELQNVVIQRIEDFKCVRAQDTEQSAVFTPPPAPGSWCLGETLMTAVEGSPNFESFNDYNLKEPLLRGIYSYGFEKPSYIQRHGIKPILDGHDTIGQAQLGAGKTATFVIGCLQRIDFGLKACQGLILASTRELANQIQTLALALGSYCNIRCHCCIGGTSVRDDIDKLRDGQHLLVGTPGRVFDMIGKRHFRVDHLITLVLDEADVMLAYGLHDQIFNIFKTLPPKIQVCLFSATMPPEILDFTSQFMRDPVHINDELTFEVRQFYVAIEKDKWKCQALCNLLDILTCHQSLIYCNTCRKVYLVAEQLSKLGITTSTLHADFNHKEHDLVMNEFRLGSSQILITKEVLERNIDVRHVSIVINFDFPANTENYMQRIGRHGRFGRKGFVINFITDSDVRVMKDIEKFYHTQIEEMPMDIMDLIEAC